jgi:hypothetical protein
MNPTPAEALAATQAFLRAGPLDQRLGLLKTEHGIRFKQSTDLLMLDYHMIDVKWTEPYGYCCRGLVLDAQTLEPVAMGLPKFFNTGEHYAADLDWSSSHVFEKLDGSMVCRFFNQHTQTFQYTTRFQTPDDLATHQPSSLADFSWQDIVDRAVDDHQFDQPEHETWVLEVMSPLTRIVVPHQEFKFRLLARRDLRTLQEVSVAGHPLAPRLFSLGSAQDAQDLANTLDGTTQEGFVAVDAGFNRVKIKGISYLSLHRLKDGLGSIGAVINLAKTGDYEEVLAIYPEYRPAVEQAAQTIGRVLAEHEACYERTRGIQGQKEFALAAQASGIANTGLIFQTRAGKYGSVKEAFYGLREAAFVDLVARHMGPIKVPGVG